MKTLSLLLVQVVLLASAMGQEVQSRPDLTDPTVLKLKALLPLRQQAKVREFLLANGQQAKLGEFLGWQKLFAMLSDKDVLLLMRAEEERPNYPGNAYAKDGCSPWLLILKDSGASDRLLGK